jgi:hypothetical protein
VRVAVRRLVVEGGARRAAVLVEPARDLEGAGDVARDAGIGVRLHVVDVEGGRVPGHLVVGEVLVAEAVERRVADAKEVPREALGASDREVPRHVEVAPVDAGLLQDVEDVLVALAV